MLTRLGYVEMEPLRPQRKLETGERSELVRPRARGVDHTVGTDAAGGGRDREAVRLSVGFDVDARHLRVCPDCRARLDGAEREERRGESRVGVPFLGAERCAGEIVREIGREAAQLLALEDLDVESCLFLDLALLVEEPQLILGLGNHQSASEVDVEAAVELALEPLPHLRRLCMQPHLGLEALANVLGFRPRQLVDGDLEVEASCIRSGRLAIQLAALDENHLHPLARQIVGE